MSSERLYQILSTLFCVIVILSNLITIKLFRAPLFPNLALPAGIITYPLSFLISDLVTELYGAKKARFMVYMGFSMCLLTFFLIKTAYLLPSYTPENQEVFKAAFGLNGLIIISSLTAFVVGQVIDVGLFAWIKKRTEGQYLWLRNNVSTLISQFFDTVIVNFLLLYFGMNIKLSLVMQAIFFAYLYKGIVSIFNTPLFYLAVHFGKKLDTEKEVMIKPI